MSNEVKRVTFTPIDDKQEKIVLLVKSIEFLPQHYELNMLDGKKHLLPRDQVKKMEIEDGAFADNRATRRARSKQKP